MKKERLLRKILVFYLAVGSSCKAEVWHFGLEASYFSRHEGEIPVENLMELCMKGEPVEIDGGYYRTEELLEIFLRGCLSMLGIADAPRQIRAVMITVPELNRVLVRKIQRVCSRMKFSSGQVMIQDYDESFYYYAMCTRRDNGNRMTGLFARTELLNSKDFDAFKDYPPFSIIRVLTKRDRTVRVR